MNTIKLNTIGTPCKARGNSGEGGGSTGGGNTYEYIDVRRPSGYQGDDFWDEVFTPLVYMCALMVKANVESMQIVGTSGSLVLMGDSAFQNVTAIAVDTNMEVFYGTGYSKVGDLMKEIGADSLPRLTKEEFYNLNA